MSMNFKKIQLDLIDQNENSRVVYKETDLSELMASMRKDGLLQPVGLAPLPSGHYEALYGNRRIVAAKKLGWDSIDANILSITSENERDCLNLIENIKRANTTVAEDGRMFGLLKSRGLTVKEIGARLGITEARIHLALEVVQDIPAEYHGKITNKIGGSNRKGDISASTVHQILNLRKSHELTRPQVKEVMEYVRTHETSHAQISKVGPLLKQGVTIGDALDLIEDLQHIYFGVFMKKKDVAKIEKSTGKKINQILIDYIAVEFPVQVRNVKNKFRNSRDRRYSMREIAS